MSAQLRTSHLYVCVCAFKCAFALTLLYIYCATTFCRHILTALTCPTCNTYTDPNVTLVRARKQHALNASHKCTHIKQLSAQLVHRTQHLTSVSQLHCVVAYEIPRQSLLTSRRCYNHTYTHTHMLYK